VVLRGRHWTHLAATWDGAVLRFYIDGQRLASRRVGGRLAASGLRIGGGAFRGLVDEVRLYDRALSAEQIAADMRAP
jgi:hypothetical protein